MVFSTTCPSACPSRYSWIFGKRQQQSIKMVSALPDDILHVLCTELAYQQDFDTLFNCAVTGRRLAVPALTSLYR